MHLAGRTYAARLPNPRGPRWWRQTAEKVMSHLDSAQAQMLVEELRLQGLYRFEDVPRGVVHADLFRDNVLFDNDRISGVIDFYYACDDVWLYDLAVTVNDWCFDAAGELDRERMWIMLKAYHQTRPLTAIERGAWPIMLRAAALRFWLSRLFDLYYPRPGELTHAKDPRQFQCILESHIKAQHELQRAWV
ncbi:MAG: phosphotransferase, partial [Burkholderiales bacterium]